MGVTSKGLRYPEGVVIGNTIHTKIKELAEDVDGALGTRDTRLDGLDSKTNTTNSTLALRGLPISRHGGYTPRITNLANNDANYTTHQVNNFAVVPANARTVVVSMDVNSQCNANAQNHWSPLINFGLGWNWMWGSVEYAAVHNNNNTFLNMGFSITSVYDVRSYIGANVSLAVNGRNDIGSGAWVDVGYLKWSATFQY